MIKHNSKTGSSEKKFYKNFKAGTRKKQELSIKSKDSIKGPHKKQELGFKTKSPNKGTHRKELGVKTKNPNKGTQKKKLGIKTQDPNKSPHKKQELVAKSKNLDENITQTANKRKNEFTSDSARKKPRPSPGNVKGEKFHKTGKKSEPSDKPVLNRTGKEWKQIHMAKKGKQDTMEVGKRLLVIWDELRRDDCKPDRKSQLLNHACGILKGRVKEFTYAHDTVRVLECIFLLGTEIHRTLLFDELKDDLELLSKSKYAKFFVLKMLKHGSKLQKNTIIKSFYGKVIKLIRHAEASEVVEMAFNECAYATQRSELTQEFYGPTYKFFKDSNMHSLGQLLEKNPDKKSVVIDHMKTELLKLLDKSVVKHSLVHHVLWQFLSHCDASSRSEIIEALREAVPEILHTKDGSRVAMDCVWYGTVKDRKAIVKAMKTFVAKIAKEEHGHLVLLSIFDCYDDTKFLEKHIIKELLTSSVDLSKNVHGKKVLIYLLSPRDSHYIHPDVIKILQKGDNNETSKKDPEIRQAELKAVVAEPLLQLIADNIQALYMDNAFCLFTVVILQHTVGNRKSAFKSIAELSVEPYQPDNKNIHVIEQSGSNFMLKQLLLQDQRNPEPVDCTFSEVLVKTVPKLVFKSWIDCNRGAFLLVSLMETNIPAVVERIKSELKGCNTYISKKSTRGAEILLKKLKE